MVRMIKLVREVMGVRMERIVSWYNGLVWPDLVYFGLVW